MLENSVLDGWGRDAGHKEGRHVSTRQTEAAFFQKRALPCLADEAGVAAVAVAGAAGGELGLGVLPGAAPVVAGVGVALGADVAPVGLRGSGFI